MKYYTVYLKKNDEIVAQGTGHDCATTMGKSLNGFHSLVSKTKKGIQHKYEVLIEELNQDEVVALDASRIKGR